MVDGGAGSGSERPISLELVRVSIAPEGAFSVLLIDGVPAGPVCVERTYPVDPASPRGPQFVRIPPGIYRCQRTHFERGGYESYEITGVVGHSLLKFHIANDEADVDGCIGVGMRFGWLGIKPAVLESREGFTEFMRLTHGRSSFELLVKDPA